MPIFGNEYTFIHIPKSGGSSIEKFMQDKGFEMKLFTDSGAIFINGHTPQHCTYQELKLLGLLTGKVFTIVRPEIERVLSEFFYIRAHRPDLDELFVDFDEFLNLFLNKENYLLFDYHNLSNRAFITDESGKIDPDLHIFSFYDIDGLENFLGLKGLCHYHHLKTEKVDLLTEDHIARIKEFYGKNS